MASGFFLFAYEVSGGASNGHAKKDSALNKEKHETGIPSILQLREHAQKRSRPTNGRGPPEIAHNATNRLCARRATQTSSEFLC
jgi:hypothetical protein